MDTRWVGLLADRQQAPLSDQTARECAGRELSRLGGAQAAARVVLVALAGAALTAAPVVT